MKRNMRRRLRYRKVMPGNIRMLILALHVFVEVFVSVVVINFAMSAGGLGFDSRAGQIGDSRQHLAIAATFLQNCVAQALNRGNGPATLYTLRGMNKCNENLCCF